MVITKLFDKQYTQVLHLKIFVEDFELREKYVSHVEQHNKNLLESKFLDAGFDLFYSSSYVELFEKQTIGYSPSGLKIDFKVKCCATMFHNNGLKHPTGYYVYPRSSLSKTSLRLANSVGIIDAGYRANLLGVFDVINFTQSLPPNGSRLVQICAPGLQPIYVEMVGSVEELGAKTERGEGGFGSTGK
jgi:dUTP pyrophosphatase